MKRYSELKSCRTSPVPKRMWRVAEMKFMTGYLVAIFFVLFGAAQFADHIGAKHCERITTMTYNQCRQAKP